MGSNTSQPDGAAIYRALVSQSKSRVRGAKVEKKSNPSAGDYAALTLKGKHLAYFHQHKLAATVEIRVDGKRKRSKLTKESDVAKAVDAIAAKASEVTPKK